MPKFMPRQQCSEDGCENKVVAVVRDDGLNGTRLCAQCLEDEGRRRGWW